MYTICVSGTVAVNVSHLGYKRQRMWYRVIMHRGAAPPSSQLPGRPVAMYGGNDHAPRRSVRYGSGLDWRPQMREVGVMTRYNRLCAQAALMDPSAAADRPIRGLALVCCRHINLRGLFRRCDDLRNTGKGNGPLQSTFACIAIICGAHMRLADGGVVAIYSRII